MTKIKTHLFLEVISVAMLQTDKDKLNDSYAALERKAELYDKLSRGQYDDDEEQYNVDFLSKGFLTDEMRIGSSARQSLIDPAKPIDTSAMAVQASSGFLAKSLTGEDIRHTMQLEYIPSCLPDSLQPGEQVL